MLLNKQQLAESLSQLSAGDYDLLNDIITDYVGKLNDKEFDDYEQFVNNNLNEIMS
tara:strand:+ start:109 stop:276 length:168 start_codon:yes stop_codon:yes gene_type:complete